MPGGYLVVSELSWLREEIPPELKAFWMAAYPEISHITENIKTIKNSGYLYVNHVILPESGWWDHYYRPLSERINILKKRYYIDK
jgi:hypothetical protein